VVHSQIWLNFYSGLSLWPMATLQNWGNQKEKEKVMHVQILHTW
jgi:hypothetical protein